MQFRFSRMVVLIVGLSLAASACGRYSISSIRSAKAFQDGIGLYQRGDYVPATEHFTEAIRLNPDFPFSYFFLGNSYDKMYRPARKGEAENDAYLQKAVENYRQSIDHLKGRTEEQAPQFLNLSYQYLIAAYGSDRLNDFAKAEEAAKELIQTTPDEPGNYQALARLYQDQGRNEDAEAMFVKAAEVRPNDPVGFQMLANFYNQQGDFDKTIAAFQKRADLEPNNPEAWHTMGTFYYDKALRDTRLPMETFRKFVSAGIAAEDHALKLNDEYYEAVTFKGMLIGLQASRERDVAVQKRLLAEATALREQSLTLRKKQEAGAAATAAATASGKPKPAGS
jgi:tetratricopeptide (TPR) repeat protein